MNKKSRRGYRRVLKLTLVIVILMLFLPNNVQFTIAQEAARATNTLETSTEPVQFFSTGTEFGNKPIGPLSKVSSDLLQVREMDLNDISVQQIQQTIPLTNFKNNRVEIEVRLVSLTSEIVKQMEAIGMLVTDVYYEYARVYGIIDPSLLEKIATIPQVTTIHPNYEPVRRAGSVANQADVSIRADQARATYGVDGSGVTIGVLSDSFHDMGGGSINGSGCSRTLTGNASQISGDIPSSVVILDNGEGGGTDEGRGMAELITDLSPGADIIFHSAYSSEADFASGINDLRNCGADIIVDDIFYYTEPIFQDGIVAQAVQAAYDNDVSYFSATGNDGDVGMQENYFNGSACPACSSYLGAHDFGTSDPTAWVDLSPGSVMVIVLQWNQPYSGTLGSGSEVDLDLVLWLDAERSSYAGGSFNSQGSTGNPSGDPFEILSLRNDGETVNRVYFSIEHFSGNTSNLVFRIIPFYCDGCIYENGIWDKYTIFGHPAAEGAIAVGAVFYGEIDTNGTLEGLATQIDVESFSSLGGNLPFYFDGSGNPLLGAPIIRFKPDIVAPDGSNTSFFGSDNPYDADTNPNFFGTSAAAPHAAAIAALMLENTPSLTPAQLVSTMQDTAIDIEIVGRDNYSGYGLIDALSALCFPFPKNDDFKNAIDISPNSIELRCTREATQDPDDPDLSPCGLVGTGKATVWYKYMAPADSSISLDTKTTDYDTFIAVWTGMRDSLTSVACNDDTGGTKQSAVAFQVAEGETYYIEIGQP